MEMQWSAQDIRAYEWQSPDSNQIVLLNECVLIGYSGSQSCALTYSKAANYTLCVPPLQLSSYPETGSQSWHRAPESQSDLIEISM